MRRLAAVIPLLAYPAWSHVAISFGHADWSLPGLVVLVVCALVIRAPRRPFSRGSALFLLALAATAAWDLATPTPVAVYLPPILIPASLAWLFGRTLRPGHTALITRFAQQIMNEDTAAVARYTRGVTWYWTLLFVALALEAAVLAIHATADTWSLFANGINYALIAAGFLVELIVRRLRFGRQHNLREFFARLVQTDLRRLG